MSNHPEEIKKANQRCKGERPEKDGRDRTPTTLIDFEEKPRRKTGGRGTEKKSHEQAPRRQKKKTDKVQCVHLKNIGGEKGIGGGSPGGQQK